MTLSFAVCSIAHAIARFTARPATGRYLLVLFLTALVRPIVAQSPLPYDRTSFLNGYSSDPSMWTTVYSNIGRTPSTYLGERIDLRMTRYPNLDRMQRYTNQVSSLTSYLAAGGQHILVGHSLGSLVARGSYIDNSSVRPDIAAILAITPPHQGTPLADNFPALRSFLRDMQRRIQDAQAAASVESIILDFIFAAFAPKQITGLGPVLFGWILKELNGTQIDLNNLEQFGGFPALADLSPSSAAIAHLNSRLDDSNLPRANITATIPIRNAALRMYKSVINDDEHFADFVHLRNLAQSTFSTCKWVGYVMVVTWTAGRRCAYARKTLGRLDERYARAVNGWDQYGNTRNIPFDGAVPYERTRYPSSTGLAFAANVNLVDHLNVYKTHAGLDQVANAMRALRMPEAPGAQQPPVTISGPSQIEVGCPNSWFAIPNGGTAPYSYTWMVGGTPYDTGSDSQLNFTALSQGTLYITVTTHDANGAAATGSLTVTVISGNCT